MISPEKDSRSNTAFRTMRLLLIGFGIDLILTLLVLIVHVADPNPVFLFALPYLASAILLFAISAVFFAAVYCYLRYPKFRKSLLFIALLTFVVLVVHLALIQYPPVTYGYYVNGSKTGIVPISQIPKIQSCQSTSNDCESCSGCVMDESYYVPAAIAIIDGIHCAPQIADCNMEHPPLSKALIAVGIAAFGDSGLDLQDGRLLPIILGTACIPLVFAIAWKFSKNRKVAYYSSLLLALDTMFFVHSSISVLDIPVIFFALTAFVTYLYDVKFWMADKYLISGALMGLAILSKETALFLVGALVTFDLLRGKQPIRIRLFSSLKIVLVAAIIFAIGLQAYDSLLTGGLVPSFLDQVHYIYTYGSSLVCRPSGFDCPGAFLNVPGNPSTAITPLSWLVYYVPTTYFRSNISICTGSVCRSFVNTAYYGVTNMIETWTTYIWAPFAAYVFYKVWKRKEEPPILKRPRRTEIQATIPLSNESIEKIAKLKSLLDSGAITKDEFDSQKSAILHARKERPVVEKGENAIQKTEDASWSGGLKQGFWESDLPILALVIFCWSYFPYLVLFAEGRVTYPFYFLPAVPAIALGSSYFITRPFFPRFLIVVFLAAVFLWFLIYFPDQSFLPSWITSSLGT